MLATRVFILSAAALLLSGCDLPLPVDCPADIGWEVSPQQRTVQVGQSFTAEAFVLSCGGRDRERASVVWRSSDPMVAQVDSVSGRVSGVAPGSTQVEARDPGGAPSFWSPVQVTVLP